MGVENLIQFEYLSNIKSSFKIRHDTFQYIGYKNVDTYLCDVKQYQLCNSLVRFSFFNDTFIHFKKNNLNRTYSILFKTL